MIDEPEDGLIQGLVRTAHILREKCGIFSWPIVPQSEDHRAGVLEAVLVDLHVSRQAHKARAVHNNLQKVLEADLVHLSARGQFTIIEDSHAAPRKCEVLLCRSEVVADQLELFDHVLPFYITENLEVVHLIANMSFAACVNRKDGHQALFVALKDVIHVVNIAVLVAIHSPIVEGVAVYMGQKLEVDELAESRWDAGKLASGHEAQDGHAH